MNFHQAPNVYPTHIELKVINLERSLSFYQNIIGFQLLEREENRAVLTADGKTPLVSLIQPADALPKEPRKTGLYHFALLLPERADLARFLHHIIKINYPLGAADHEVSEALYLQDVDGNGIEVYADRPSSLWKWNNGEVHMVTEQLNAEDLLKERKDETWQGLPKETVMGHIHLHVGNLAEAEAFYCKGLGFETAAHYGDQALFVSTGSYHHHIGLNTWNGVNASAPSSESAGMNMFTIQYPDQESVEQTVHRLKEYAAHLEKKEEAWIAMDPSGIRIILKAQ
ncbi:VOC family protein [Bacillus massiliglaciei]|uniref:VOC family protein n=1 Tax=Bacillus massiliglaciei TaxID=1816693 RepID=UPI000B1020C1|nr:VOC family protein [Bacillus massiliglaciei]